MMVEETGIYQNSPKRISHIIVLFQISAPRVNLIKHKTFWQKRLKDL